MTMAATWQASQDMAMARTLYRMNPDILPNPESLTVKEIVRSLVVALALLGAFAPPASAQDPDQTASDHQHQHDAAATGPIWTWSADANVF
jgi:hypothetical protein